MKIKARDLNIVLPGFIFIGDIDFTHVSFSC